MNILIISAHSFSLDRRIIGQVNALAEAGYNITFLSVPVYDDCSNLIDSRIKRIMPFITEGINRKFSLFKQYIRKYIPEFILILVRLYRAKLYFTRYFLEKVPKENYDIIHAHDLTTIPAAIAIKNKVSPNSKIIYDAHELYPHQFKFLVEERAWVSLERSLLPFIDSIITVNESCKLHFEKTYKNCPSVSVIYNSYSLRIEEGKTQDIKQQFKDKDLPLFIFQGMVSEGRNLENMVKAFSELNGTCNLLLLGRGSILASLKNIAAKCDNISFMDWVPQDKLPGVLQQVDFGIIPYISDGKLNNLYCTPNKLFEFINFKVPILANNLPELRRIIGGYQLGLIADLTSIDGIKVAVKQIVNQQYPEYHFAKANTDLGWEAQKEVMLGIYKKLMSKI